MEKGLLCKYMKGLSFKCNIYRTGQSNASKKRDKRTVKRMAKAFMEKELSD